MYLIIIMLYTAVTTDLLTHINIVVPVFHSFCLP